MFQLINQNFEATATFFEAACEAQLAEVVEPFNRLLFAHTGVSRIALPPMTTAAFRICEWWVMIGSCHTSRRRIVIETEVYSL